MAIHRGERGRARRLTMPVPSGFVFHRAVMGHGWYDLPPFRWDPSTGKLTRPIRLPDAGPVTLRLAAPGRSAGPLRLEVLAPGALTPRDAASARAQAARMMRLDEDLGAFHDCAERVARPNLTWARGEGAGRLLRSPTVFEDLVKMIATTNCTWALTRVMVTGLVERLGEPAAGGSRLFPTPQAMATAPLSFYRAVVRAGYRGEALRALARDVASGRLDPETWLDPALPTASIREALLSVRGAGPYVADNMLKLLGRYDGLGIDSWCRRKFSSMHAGGRRITDERIRRFYEPFGAWQGLALWCDMTRDWFEEGGPQEKLAGART
jgi:3-methyladenine DNA glycosylase/8-oxoguanine DNA glycosylase